MTRRATLSVAANAGIVVVCAVLGAHAVNQVVAGRYLTREVRLPQLRVAPARPPRPKAGDALLARNMFCSACEPPAPPVPAAVPGDPQPTALPLELLATHITAAGKGSFAAIRHRVSERVGAYRVGDEIPSAGPVVSIHARHVEFRNRASKHIERIELRARPEPSEPRSEPPRKKERPRTPQAQLLAELEDGLEKIDATHYVVDRDVFEKLLASPYTMRGARVRPYVKDGRTEGVVLSRVRSGSVAAKIGLKNGDRIHAINGSPLTSPDAALAIYAQARSARSLTVSITRRGEPVTLHYTIR